MKVKNGFAPIIFIILILIGGTSIAFGGYKVFNKNKSQAKNVVIISPTTVLNSTSTPTPTPKKQLIPTATLIPPTTDPSSVFFRIDDNGSAIMDSSLSLNIKNENTGQEQNIKNESSSWMVQNLNPGRYRFSISFPKEKYFNPDKRCEECQNPQVVSGYDTCGYSFDFSMGDNIKIYCMLRSTQPLSGNSNTSSSTTTDSIAPTTNIYYPSQNGSITYKMDGKVCAIANPPTDNVNNSNEIETEFKFDEGEWSGYATVRAYLCADSLSNGSHSLSYHSKDKAGNVEATRTIQFTVNIPGN